MITGQGTTFIQPNIATPAAVFPPFPLNAADNGLSVDPITGEIVLGQAIGEPGDPAKLLSNREIPLNNFSFATDPVGLIIDPLNMSFLFGDFNNIGNGNQLFINDVGQRWSIGQATPVTNLLLNFPGAGIGLSFFDSNGNNPFLLPDPATGGIAFISAPDFSQQLSLSDAGSGSTTQLGDVGALGNNSIITISDPGQALTYKSGLTTFLSIDPPNDIYWLGDGNGAFSDTFAYLDGSFGFEVKAAGFELIQMDITSGQYQFGPTIFGGNNTHLVIEDTLLEFQFSDASNLSAIRMNGVLGFTGTVAPPLTITVNGGIVTNVA
jgi:hypothetical protein